METLQTASNQPCVHEFWRQSRPTNRIARTVTGYDCVQITAIYNTVTIDIRLANDRRGACTEAIANKFEVVAIDIAVLIHISRARPHWRQQNRANTRNTRLQCQANNPAVV